jgi:integrase
VPRQSTGLSDLKQAEAFRDSLLASHKPASGDSTTGPTVAECVEQYLVSREAELDTRTLSQHKLALGRLERHLAARGVVFIRQVTVDHLETFKHAGLPKEMKSTTRATTDAKIRCFLREAFRRGWIKEAIVERVRPVHGVYEQKEPYTDEEVQAILSQAELLNGGTHGYAAHPKTFRLLLELMLATGMRVGDAVAFDPRLLVKGDTLWSYSFVPQKRERTRKPKVIEAYLTDSMVRKINECEWLSRKGPFWYGAGTDPTPLAQAVYERMQSIGARLGIADCRPHRLRDTFAVRRLLAGMQLEDVSRLLGHSSVKVTETYYAKWVASRKKRLERALAETLMDS